MNSSKKLPLYVFIIKKINHKTIGVLHIHNILKIILRILNEKKKLLLRYLLILF